MVKVIKYSDQEVGPLVLELEKELLSDEKELAEHNMLVDLGRNDIGRKGTFKY